MRIYERELLVAEDGTAYLESISSKNYSKLEKINTPKEIHQIMVDNYNLDKKAEEHIYMIAINKKSKPISFFEISHGSADASIVDVRGVMLKALLSNATNVFLVHNHPSKDITPSKEDVRTTTKVKEACQLVGLELVDHIIIGGSNYFSFRESCLI